MEYRLLGATGLRVSALGFGGIPIQRVTNEEAVRIIDTAVAQGINFFDTARGYTDSESKLGAALKGKRDRVILASKAMSRTFEGMTADIERSLSELGTDYIDLYQCHNIRTNQEVSVVLGPGGAFEALAAARKSGKIRHIGITGHSPEVLVEALKSGAFETVQVPYNYFERGAEEVLFPLAQKLQIGTIAMKPLAGSAFAHPGPALRFLLNKNLSTVIPGMDSVEQVLENTALAREIRALTPEETACLEQEAASMGDRFCRRCDYCRPCTKQIDISMCFNFHNYFKRYHLQEWARERYQAMAAHADACVECGHCESRCPYGLPIREMLKEVHQDLG